MFAEDVWQQDGATCHTAGLSMDLIKRHFEFVISKRSPDASLQWPPCSPDLAPCDYFLWGHMKNKIYPLPGDRTQLKARVLAAVASIPQDMIERACRAFVSRVKSVLEADGGHPSRF